MSPLVLAAIGLVMLALFCFGGTVQGRGERAYTAAAARAFIGPWVLVGLGNLWVRWWQGGLPVAEVAAHLGVMALLILAAFAVWRHYRPR